MNVPNLLSIFRIALVPVFALVFFRGGELSRVLSAGVFALAVITDIADGYIARRFDQITKLGRVLDPLADKLLKSAAAVCLTMTGVIPLYIMILLLTKEVLLLSGGLVLIRRVGDVPSANFLGKAAEAFICVLTLTLILIDLPPALTAALWLAAIAVEIFALSVYAVRALGIIRSDKRGKT